MNFQTCLHCLKPILTPDGKFPTSPQPGDKGICDCSHYVRTSSDWRWKGFTKKMMMKMMLKLIERMIKQFANVNNESWKCQDEMCDDLEIIRKEIQKSNKLRDDIEKDYKQKIADLESELARLKNLTLPLEKK